MDSMNKKKKICFVVSTPYTSKAFLENHFEKLSSFYELYLIANLEDKDIINYSHPNLTFVKHIPIERKINLLKDLEALYKTIVYFRQNKFDAVICFTPKAGLIGITASWFARIKKRIHFFTGQVWHTKKGVFKFFLKTLDKLVVALCTDVLVDGKPQQKYLIANKILSSSNSKVIGKGTISGIDVSKFSPNPKLRIEQRKLLNYNENDFIFLFLGRINKDKGIFDLLEAFLKLNKLYNDTKLLIVGPDEEQIEKKTKKLNYPLHSINFYGSSDEPNNLFQVADVFCLPSHREAFGLSIIEASSTGLPIICSDTYGLMDSIVDEVTGIRHKVHDSDSLYNVMRAMYLDEDLRNSLGINGRKYVIENFSKETVTSLWVAYFQSILK